MIEAWHTLALPYQALPAMKHASISADVLVQRLLVRGRLRQLQLVVALAESGSVQRAAQAMAMSQPAATQALADLETLVGEALFERHARGVRLTRFGQVLLPLARSVLQSVRAASQSIAALQAGAQSLLRLGSIPAGTAGVLAHALPRWIANHPDVQLDVVEDHSRHLLAELTANRLDAVLCRQPNDFDSAWQFAALRDDQPAFIASPQHPLVTTRRSTWKLACRYPWLMPHQGMALREHLAPLWSDALPSHPPLHPLSTTSLPVILKILEDRRTIAVSPSCVVQPLVQAGQVALLHIALPQLLQEPVLPPLGLLYRSDSEKRPLLEQLRAHLQQQDSIYPTT